MNVTGNDIIDMKLAAATNNWRRAGYLDKVFTPLEQRYITASSIPDEMVWRLWSMKESAYKIYTRQYGGRFFAPQKLSCTLLTQTVGIVDYNCNSYRTFSITTDNYIYTTACIKDAITKELVNSCFKLPQQSLINQQQFIYNKIINCFYSIHGDVKNRYRIVKDKNDIPYIQNQLQLRVPISITHHGQFAAFTIQ